MIDGVAHIADGVRIGTGTNVWQFASVIRGAEIGENCSIGACSIVDCAKIGDRCSVGHGAQLHPGLLAGNEVFFGPGCIICNDPWPRVRKADFDIGAIMAGFITVRIGDGASIGAGAIVLPGNTIGEGAMIAAGAVVDQNVPAGHLFKRGGLLALIGRRQVVRMRVA
jgi:UDP-2-acetamido-3-amino-2,3-dideoxy-glucuronate N-acetyltransferase